MISKLRPEFIPRYLDRMPLLKTADRTHINYKITGIDKGTSKEKFSGEYTAVDLSCQATSRKLGIKFYSNASVILIYGSNLNWGLAAVDNRIGVYE